MFGFIYISTNTLNGMQYIGQTHYREKMNPNYFGSGKAIKRAIAKNGLSVFAREIIFEAFTKDDLDWAEKHFIAEYDAVKSRNFYNIAPGGRASLGFTGKKHTLERNAKLSEKMKGHKVSDKTRQVCGQLASQRQRGKMPACAIPVSINGIDYKSIKHACEVTGLSRGKIKQMNGVQELACRL